MDFSEDIIKVKLSDLKLDPKNTRVHDQHNIEIIKKSLKKYKQYRPFVVQKDNMMIRVGNGMYQAMLSLAEDEGTNIDEVEVNCVIKDMTNEEAETLSILDNKASDTSYFDNVQLAEILKDMDQSNIELTGFCDQEVSKLLDNLNIDIEKVIENNNEDNKKEKDVKKGILQYQLIFENEQQLDIWKKFVDEVKDKYGESICESLVLFIQDTNNKEPFF